MISLVVINQHKDSKVLVKSIRNFIEYNRHAMEHITSFNILNQIENNIELTTALKVTFPQIKFLVKSISSELDSVALIDLAFQQIDTKFLFLSFSGVKFIKEDMAIKSLKILEQQPNIVQVNGNLNYEGRVNPAEGQLLYLDALTPLRRLMPISYKYTDDKTSFMVENQIGVSIEPGMMRKSDWEFTGPWSTLDLRFTDLKYSAKGMFVVTLCETTKEQYYEKI